MRIASYNIRKAVGLDWKRDPNRIMQVLSEINADVVAIQEMDKRFGQRSGTISAKELAKELDYEIASVSVRPLSHGWHGNAILFKSSLVLNNAGRIDLPKWEPRGAVYANLTSPNAGPIQIVGIHLAMAKHIRRHQANKIAEHINGTSNVHSTIVAGDFNDRKETLDYNFFDDQDEVITPGPSFHTTRPYLPLDRFVLGKGLSAVNMGVHMSDASKKASDHLPIYVDIKNKLLNKED